MFSRQVLPRLQPRQCWRLSGSVRQSPCSGGRVTWSCSLEGEKFRASSLIFSSKSISAWPTPESDRWRWRQPAAEGETGWSIRWSIQTDRKCHHKILPNNWTWCNKHPKISSLWHLFLIIKQRHIHSIYTVLYSMKSDVIVTQNYVLGVINLWRWLLMNFTKNYQVLKQFYYYCWNCNK